jgi:protein TonB
MFESALLAAGPGPRRRGIALPVSIALHAAAVLAVAGAALWRGEDPGEPPIPVVWTGGPPAVPAAGAPTESPHRSAAAPRTIRSADSSSEIRAAAPGPETTGVSAESGEPASFAFGTDDGLPGGDGDIWGALPGNGAEPGDSASPLVPGGDVRAPQIVFRVDPDYPEVARKARVQGTVVLEAVIGTDGAIESLRVLRPLFPPLDEAAKRAVSEWRYRAATLHGQAVRVLLHVTVDFRLH